MHSFINELDASFLIAVQDVFAFTQAFRDLAGAFALVELPGTLVYKGPFAFLPGLVKGTLGWIVLGIVVIAVQGGEYGTWDS